MQIDIRAIPQIEAGAASIDDLGSFDCMDGLSMRIQKNQEAFVESKNVNWPIDLRIFSHLIFTCL